MRRQTPDKNPRTVPSKTPDRRDRKGKGKLGKHHREGYTKGRERTLLSHSSTRTLFLTGAASPPSSIGDDRGNSRKVHSEPCRTTSHEINISRRRGAFFFAENGPENFFLCSSSLVPLALVGYHRYHQVAQYLLTKPTRSSSSNCM